MKAFQEHENEAGREEKVYENRMNPAYLKSDINYFSFYWKGIMFPKNLDKTK